MMTKPKRLFKHRPIGNLESKATRLAIADAVHRAVCQYTASDGVGSCHRYAVAGQGLLQHLGKPTVLQAGSLHVLVDDVSQYAMSMLGENWHNGELHVWLGYDQPLEAIDFSSRLYKKMWEELLTLDDEWVSWTRPEPPPYVWALKDKLPKWLKLQALPEPTKAVWKHHDDHHDLIALAIEEYKNCRRW